MNNNIKIKAEEILKLDTIIFDIFENDKEIIEIFKYFILNKHILISHNEDYNNLMESIDIIISRQFEAINYINKNKGIMICPKCKGFLYKLIKFNPNKDNYTHRWNMCDFCTNGTVDWIKNIVGK